MDGCYFILGAFLYIPHFSQLMCRKWHDECLFLRLWRSPVGEALLLILESNCIQVFLGNGFYACVQCTMSSLGLFVPGCHRRRTSKHPLPLAAAYLRLCTDLPFAFFTWYFPHFVGICHAIFLLCCASVLISMALQSIADTCYQMQIVLCFWDDQ